MNPHWNDETLFQEARRINIAWYQNALVSSRFLESLFKEKVNETYNENVDPATTLEFNTAAYRFLHYFANSDFELINSEGQTTSIPVSETFGRVDVLENNFSDILRGLLKQSMNFDQYSDEVS
jgi:peroxidase